MQAWVHAERGCWAAREQESNLAPNSGEEELTKLAALVGSIIAVVLLLLARRMVTARSLFVSQSSGASHAAALTQFSRISCHRNERVLRSPGEGRDSSATSADSSRVLLILGVSPRSLRVDDVDMGGGDAGEREEGERSNHDWRCDTDERQEEEEWKSLTSTTENSGGCAETWHN